MPDEADYRPRVMTGFMDEARQELSDRWRSCVDNSQLAVENAAKAVLALLGPVGRTHNPAVPLRQALDASRFPGLRASVQALLDCVELLGPDVHIRSDYGDEAGGRTPWELFSEADARQAFDLAERAAEHATEIVAKHT